MGFHESESSKQFAWMVSTKNGAIVGIQVIKLKTRPLIIRTIDFK
jgi:hypothetical protein